MSKLATLFLFCNLSLFANHITYTPIKTSSPKRKIHTFKIDPHWVSIEPINGNDRCLGIETVSSIATRKSAVLAINGSDFQGGRMLGAPNGPFKLDGLACGYRSHITGAIGWQKRGRESHIDRIRSVANLVIHGKRTLLDAVNRNLYPANRVVYTSNFHACTMTPPGCREYPIKGGIIKRLLHKNGSTSIPEGGMVYAEGEKIKVPLAGHFGNKKAQLRLEYHPLFHSNRKNAWKNFAHIVHGIVILENGKAVRDYHVEKVNDVVINHRHARTAIGIDQQGMWRVVVVEAHYHGNVGMTLDELGNFMHSIGCKSAIALDGGGSSTLYYRGKSKQFHAHSHHSFSQENIFYHPEGGERPVGNAIVFK